MLYLLAGASSLSHLGALGAGVAGGVILCMCLHPAGVFVSRQGQLACHILAPWAPVCLVPLPCLSCFAGALDLHAGYCCCLVCPWSVPCWDCLSYLGDVCGAAGDAVPGRRWLADRQVTRQAVSWHAVCCGMGCVLRPIGRVSGQAAASRTQRRPLPACLSVLCVCDLVKCVACAAAGVWQTAHTVGCYLTLTLARGCVCATEGSVACPDRTLLGKVAVVAWVSGFTFP